jgi:hypothetical protein
MAVVPQHIMNPANTSTAARKMRARKESFWRKGLNGEKLPTPPSRGKNFLLTLPFIEPGQKDAVQIRDDHWLKDFKP